MRARESRIGVVAVAAAVAAIYSTVALTLFPSDPPAENNKRRLYRTAATTTLPPKEVAAVAAASVAVLAPAEIDPEALNIRLDGATRSISCPMFSGPGYDKTRHPSHTISIPALEAPFIGSAAPPPRLDCGRPA